MSGQKPSGNCSSRSSCRRHTLLTRLPSAQRRSVYDLYTLCRRCKKPSVTAERRSQPLSREHIVRAAAATVVVHRGLGALDIRRNHQQRHSAPHGYYHRFPTRASLDPSAGRRRRTLSRSQARAARRGTAYAPCSPSCVAHPTRPPALHLTRRAISHPPSGRADRSRFRSTCSSRQDQGTTRSPRAYRLLSSYTWAWAAPACYSLEGSPDVAGRLIKSLATSQRGAGPDRFRRSPTARECEHGFERLLAALRARGATPPAAPSEGVGGRAAAGGGALMKVQMIVPARRRRRAFWRSIRYSLFPSRRGDPRVCSFDDQSPFVDKHVERLDFDDEPDLVRDRPTSPRPGEPPGTPTTVAEAGACVCLGGFVPAAARPRGTPTPSPGTPGHVDRPSWPTTGQTVPERVSVLAPVRSRALRRATTW